MSKGVDTSPVVTAKVSAQGITLTRQSLGESSSAYLCYDRVIRVLHILLLKLQLNILTHINFLQFRVSRFSPRRGSSIRFLLFYL